MPKISLSGPADLLTILPFHLGFQPSRSVVVVCFHGKRIGLVARFDLAPDHLAEASAAGGLPTLVRDKPSSVCLVGFEDEAGESESLSSALRAALEQERVVVQDRLVVRDGRWFSVDCDCCPPDGRRLPEPADVPGVAGYIALGHSVLDDRDCLAGLVRPLDDGDPRHAEVEAAIDLWQARYTVAVAIDRIRARQAAVDDADEVLAQVRELEELANDLDGLADVLGEGPDGDDWVDGGTGREGDGVEEGEHVEAGDDGGGEVAGSRGLAPVLDLDAGRSRRATSSASRGPSLTIGAAEPADGDDTSDLDAIAMADPRRVRALAATESDEVDDLDEVDDVEDDEAWLAAGSMLLQAESLVAWSGVLRGEVTAEGLVERAPALVGPLRDVVFRDALIAWLCPDTVPLSEFPEPLVELLEALLGRDIRAAAAAESVAPQPRPRRGRRKRGRRVDRLDRLGRRAVTSIDGRLDGHRSAWEDWRAWEEASAPHLVQARLESVCRAVPASQAAPLLSVVGSYAWWRGDGARAGVAIDGALDLEPDHRLAGLIRDALDHGLRGRGAGSPHDDGRRQGASGSWNSPSSA